MSDATSPKIEGLAAWIPSGAPESLGYRTITVDRPGQDAQDIDAFLAAKRDELNAVFFGIDRTISSAVFSGGEYKPVILTRWQRVWFPVRAWWSSLRTRAGEIVAGQRFGSYDD